MDGNGKIPYYVIGSGLLILLASIHLFFPSLFLFAEKAFFDTYCRLSAKKIAHPKVALVNIGDQDLKWNKRGTVELRDLDFLLKNLSSRGVKAIGVVLPPSLSMVAHLKMDTELSPPTLFYSHSHERGAQLLPGRSLPVRTAPFPLKLASLYLGSSLPTKLSVLNSARLGHNLIPISQGEILVSFSSKPDAFPSYSYSKLLNQHTSPLSLGGKVVIMGLMTFRGEPLSTPFTKDASPAQFMAHVVDDLIGGNVLSRPNFTGSLEALCLIILGGALLIFAPKAGQGTRFAFFIVACTLSISIGYLCFLYLKVWIKTFHIIVGMGALYLLIQFVDAFQFSRLKREVIYTNKLLASSLRKQGLLDMAFERLKLCPLDNETRDMLYDLGLDYEIRGIATQALAVYEHIQKKGPYRELARRISNLKSLQEIPGFDPEGAKKNGNKLADSLIKERSLVGRYQILEPLGKGTMGIVYKGLDPKLNRLVAIKIIRFSDEFDEEMIEEIKSRFFAEAAIAGRLSHPNIVIIYDVGEDLDLTYMAMEFVEGRDLSYYCVPERLLSLAQALEVTAKIASALDYAHNRGLIHRDIKPANIIITNGGDIKVADFGIAKAVSSTRTKTGVILGTPSYMSPEQIMGHKIDPRSDIFSLGVLLYQLLTGKLPFEGQNLNSLLLQITQGPHLPVRHHNPTLPRACDQIINKALAKNPKDRFSSCAQMAKYLGILAAKVREYQRKEKH